MVEALSTPERLASGASRTLSRAQYRKEKPKARQCSWPTPWTQTSVSGVFEVSGVHPLAWPPVRNANYFFCTTCSRKKNLPRQQRLNDWKHSLWYSTSWGYTTRSWSTRSRSCRRKRRKKGLFNKINVHDKRCTNNTNETSKKMIAYEPGTVLVRMISYRITYGC